MNVKLIINLKPLNIEPLAIAKYFYEQGIKSRLSIQKLIYFAFLEGLKNNLLLFSEKFQAWKYGPVLHSVFKEMTNQAANLDAMFAQVFPIQEKRVISLLEETYQKYKGCDVWELVEESHRGPWEKTRNELDEEEISNKEIELEDLFKFVINDYLRDEKEKEDNFTIKTIGSDVKEIKNILENASQSEQKVEFFRKLSQLNPQELEEIHDTEEMLNNFSKVRIKY